MTNSKHFDSNMYKKYLQEQTYTNSTSTRYYKGMQHFCRWLESQGIQATQADYNTLLNYIAYHRKQQVSDATLRNYMNFLRQFFSFLQQQGKIESNPARHLKLKKQSGYLRSQNLLFEVLSKAELEEVYQIYILNPRILLRSRILLGLCVFQGIATGEECRILIKDVHLQKGQIQISGGTRHATRQLPLDARQILLLHQYIEQRQGKTYLIDYKNAIHATNARTNMMVQLNLELKRKQADMSVQNLQQIRRSIIVDWLKRYNIRIVQYMAGHRSISSTEKYKGADIDQLHQAISKFHPLNDIVPFNDADTPQ